MKKSCNLVLGFLTLCLCVCLGILSSPPAYAADISYPVTGGNLSFDVTTGTVTGCDTAVTEAVIPESIYGVTVTAIGDQAFNRCTELAKVSIPSTVTSIGSYAFNKCGVLGSITIPSGVTTIGDSAFRDCDSLTRVIIPDSVTSIGSAGFYMCDSLVSVTMGDGVTVLPSSIFAYCPALQKVTLPNRLTTIEGKCFETDYNLTSLDLPSTITTLEDYAFFRSGVRSLTIPASVTSIGEYLFWGANIEDITIQASVASIPRYSFSGSNLKRLVITGDVTSILGSSFTECSSLTSVTLPASLTTIESISFWSSDNITDVYFAGDINQWANVKIGTQNGSLTTATLHLAEKVAGFSDVTTNDYYASAVKWAKETGVTSGTSDTTFSPKSTVTRAQAMTFLWKAAGQPEPTSSTSPFVDVTDPTAYYYKPILWAAEQGITSGVDATHFGVNNTLAYDQILTFLCKAAGGTITGDWSQSAQNWAKANGLTDGVSFAAKNGCPRADVVYFLWKQMR